MSLDLRNRQKYFTADGFSIKAVVNTGTSDYLHRPSLTTIDPRQMFSSPTGLRRRKVAVSATVLRSIHTCDLVGVNNCVNYSHSNGLYCT